MAYSFPWHQEGLEDHDGGGGGPRLLRPQGRRQHDQGDRVSGGQWMFFRKIHLWHFTTRKCFTLETQLAKPNPLHRAWLCLRGLLYGFHETPSNLPTPSTLQPSYTTPFTLPSHNHPPLLHTTTHPTYFQSIFFSLPFHHFVIVLPFSIKQCKYISTKDKTWSLSIIKSYKCGILQVWCVL